MDQSNGKKIVAAKWFPVLAGALVFIGLFLSSLYSFLLSHSLSEMFSIAVAFAIFMLVWNSKDYFDNNYLQFIGIAYFFVGVFDLIHTLAFKGMNIFQGYDTNLPTQLWIAGRYMQGLSLFAAPYVTGRKINHVVILSAYCVLSLFLLTAVFTGAFPACYVEGAGLTPFKIISEYIISFILLASILPLLARKKHFEENVLKLIAGSIVLTVISELAFTSYVSVYSLSNLIGHYFKIIAYYLLYRAIVVTGLTRPYELLFRNLKRSEETLLMHRERLEYLVGQRTLELKRTNEELEQEIAERYEAERYITASNALLKLLSKMSSRKEYLDALVKLIADWSGCRCAGVRIMNEDGYIPYEAYTGFSREFWESENLLSLDKDQCACTRILRGSPEPQDAPAITPFGSFCCNNTSKFVSGLSDYEKTRFRGVCIQSGFASVAVIPVRDDEKIIAAVHLADEEEEKFSNKFVNFFETLTPLIGEAIQKLDAKAERIRLAAAIESSAEAIVITNPAGIVQYLNSAFERITGYGKKEIVGRSLYQLNSGEHEENFYGKISDTLKNGQSWSGQITSRKKDGVLYEEYVTISPVKSPSGEILNYVAVRRDVTDKLRLESIAEAVNTMNNIGYIISGIRHEIGNPINSTKMALSVLKANLDKYEKATVKEYIDRSLAELSNVELLLRSLKNFNMFETPEPRNIRVSQFMENLVSLIKEDFSRRGISVKTTVEPGADLCYADPRALQQALMNILTNASDACSGRANPEILINTSKASGIITIRVSDNGCGMAEEQQKELFRPFFTTKAHGTGLGLVIVRKMLAKMNGTISVKSKKDEGTVVDIFIPEGINEN